MCIRDRFSILCLITKLALFLLLALTTSFVNADDPADDRPVIMCPTLPLHSGPVASDEKKRIYQDAVIFRELGRQLVLNVFREEFGLPTRDESLFETIDLTSDHLFEVDVVTIQKGPFKLFVRHKGQQVFYHRLERFFAAGNGHRCANVLEKVVKPKLVAAIEKLGYKRIKRNKPVTRAVSYTHLRAHETLR